MIYSSCTRAAKSSLQLWNRPLGLVGQTSMTLRCYSATTTTTPTIGSVVNLSTLDAVEKFVQLNSKCCVYYTAVWCGPCRAIQPIYGELAATDSLKTIAFGKVDVDDNPDAAASAQIRAVPTFVFYHGSKPIQTFSGADTQQLRSTLENLSTAEPTNL
jgi:thioredoxin-like negative regulator of GroEL